MQPEYNRYVQVTGKFVIMNICSDFYRKGLRSGIR